MDKESVKRILNNDLTLLIARSNEGKSMLIYNLIKDYQTYYDGSIELFGNEDMAKKLGIKSFNSMVELEDIKQSIIFIDEVGLLMDLQDRQRKKQTENVLRLVNHNGNKIFLGGLPMDFRRFLCAKAKVFLFKTLLFSDLVNGSIAKEVVKQYEGKEKGQFSLKIDIDKVLCYDGRYFKEKVAYLPEFDTKKDNVNLFSKKQYTKPSNITNKQRIVKRISEKKCSKKIIFKRSKVVRE